MQVTAFFAIPSETSKEYQMSNSKIVIAALYKFVRLEDYAALRELLQMKCQQEGIRGTLLLAREGINGTVAGFAPGIQALLDYLHKDPRLADLEWKESYAESNPFYRMKVRLKKEIVTLGVPEVDPTQVVGTYVNPKDWNALIQDPDVVLIDTRNQYEYTIGTFKGAIDPKTDSFRQFPNFVKENLTQEDQKKKVAMFCTGGIRCEKASSYMLHQGFKEVYHLKGGILKYLEEVPSEESLWEGECFVFDGRVGVTHGLEEGDYDQCYGCRYPITAEDKQSGHYIQGVSCPRCYTETSDTQKDRFQERHRQVQLAKRRGVTHLGS
jgi:UPF0176 protein